MPRMTMRSIDNPEHYVFILKSEVYLFINIDAVNNINKIVAPLGNLN